MKVASFDRTGSWRPPNADARAVSVNRLQTIAASSAGSVEPQNLASGTELPPMPVQKAQDATSRPVLQSDVPAATLQVYASGGISAAQGASVSTVDAYSSTSAPTDSTQPAERVAEITSTTGNGGPDTGRSQSLLEQQQARLNPDNLTVLEVATQAAAARAVEQANRDAAQPPKEPLSKMLMDQVKSLWAASGKAVEASFAPPPPALPTRLPALPLSASTSVDVTYSVPRRSG